jgi:hypothetical protein
MTIVARGTLPLQIKARTLPKQNFSFWNRLEPRARSNDFSRSIQARIADPLWLLARQWQMGEFKGEDAGSPVKTQLAMETTRLTRYAPGLPDSNAPVSAVTNSMPLESVVEREYPALDWRTRVQIGQQLEREVRRQGQAAGETVVGQVIDHFRKRYSLDAPGENNRLEIDDATWRFLAVVAGRAIDGGKLIEEGEVTKSPNLVGLDGDALAVAGAALESLSAWHAALYPHSNQSVSPAWQHDRLEYAFSVSAPANGAGTQQRVLVASDRGRGDLDWYSFSAHADSNIALGGQAALYPEEFAAYRTDAEPEEYIPTHISFRGMPNSRWWEFEDQQTDFGDLDVGTTDLGKLLLMEFALIHANDWFIIPAPLQAGSLCRVQSLKVTDVFGLTTEIRRAGSGEGEAWQNRWGMFGISLTMPGNAPATSPSSGAQVADFLLLPPVLGRSEESPALEDVRFLRDEMANMVWAVEHTILSGSGEPLSGYENYRDHQRRLQEKTDRALSAAIKDLAEQLSDIADEAMEAAGRAIRASTPEAAATYTNEAREKLRAVARLHPETKTQIEEVIGIEDIASAEALIPYRLASTVPGNWIPYIPVHTGNDRRAIQLRRGAMVTNVADEQPAIVPANSHLLVSAGDGHRVNEEAASRAGTGVRLIAQRTRWTDGSTHTWLGRKTGPGRGEGAGGLKFDYLRDA